MVIDLDHPDCRDYTVLEPIQCDNAGPCEIYDLVVDPLECNNDGTYGIAINFEVDNPGNELFEVFDANFNLLGSFPIADLPVVIEDFHPSGNDFDWIKVCINDVPNCCRVAEFEALDCGGGDCQIYEVIAEAHPCDENGQFLVDIDFQFENVGNTGYKIVGNGVNYGTFSYEEEYVTVGPLYGDGQTVYEFVVIDLAHPDCQNYTVLGPIQCDNAGPCEIYELAVEPLECDGEGTFSIVVDFEHQNTSDAGFKVFSPKSVYRLLQL